MGQVLSHFWSQSFHIPTPPLTEKNLPDQSGRVFIVTGSNTGVGYQLASILYGANATVYVAARTETKAIEAISQIKSAHPSSKGKLTFLKLDLSDLSTIKATAHDFLSKENRLDVLVNNAGVMDPPKNSRGAQGHELQYATNILGPFLLTKLLLPILKSTAALPDTPKDSVRVSWAGSLGVVALSPRPGGLKFKPDGDLDDSIGSPPAYGTSKTANVFFGVEFARRSGNEDGVLHNSFNPGNLASELQRHSKEKYGIFAKPLNLLLYPAVFGAYTELYAACSPDFSLKEDQGVYVLPWGRKGGVRSDIEKEIDRARKGDEGGLGEKLWSWCEKETSPYQ